MTDTSSPVVRRIARSLALTPAVLVLLGASAALAEAPEQWANPEPVSRLYALLILVVIPVVLFAGIWLMASIPALVRGEKYTPGLAWRNENEWFGGPLGGIETADRAEPEAIEPPEGSDRGGARAQW